MGASPGCIAALIADTPIWPPAGPGARRSIGLGETTFVLPFDYLHIVYSVLTGIVAFAELPGLWSWVGMAVIIGASLYLLRTDAAGRTLGEKPST